MTYTKLQYVKETFLLAHGLRGDDRTCKVWSPALTSYPTSNVVWSLRDEPDLVILLFVDGVWGQLAPGERTILQFRASAGTWRRPTDVVSPIPISPPIRRAAWEAAVLQVVQETIAAQNMHPLPSPRSSPLWAAYAGIRQHASALLTASIDLMCAADACATARDVGHLFIGPSTAIDGSWGAISLGANEGFDVPLEGRVLPRGTYAVPSITAADGYVWDCGVVMSIPAVVVSAELARRPPNVRMHRAGRLIWVGTRGRLVSEELFLGYPVDAVIPPAVVPR